MVVGLLAVTAIPTVTGVSQAVSSQKKQNASAKEQEKFHMTAVYTEDGGREHETGFCVLKDKRLIVKLAEDGEAVEGYPFCGYYFTYPSDEKHLGMVSTISDDPPMLNWIYVNQETHALEFGSRKETLGHVTGPWGWSDDEAFLTLQGSQEGFVARRWQEEEGESDDDSSGKEKEGGWAIYWDPVRQMAENAKRDGGCVRVRLRRRRLLDMESRYVRE